MMKINRQFPLILAVPLTWKRAGVLAVEGNNNLKLATWTHTKLSGKK
jgi:hypothetical protein